MTISVSGTTTFVLPDPVQGSTGPAGPAGPAGVSPAPADVAAVLAGNAVFVASVAALLLPATPAPVNTAIVYNDGVFDWAGDFNWNGALANYRAVDPVNGGLCLTMTSPPQNATPPTFGAGGGWLPYYKSGTPFSLTGYNFLNISLLATRVGQAWIIPPAEGVNDTNIGGIQIDPTKYSVNGPLVIGRWTICKIPLSAMGLSQSSKMAKFGVADQMAFGSHPENAPNNVYSINGVYFS